MKERELKQYKGFRIFKTWETDINANGRYVQTGIVYMANDSDGNNFNCAKNLKDLKKSIDNYVA